MTRSEIIDTHTNAVIVRRKLIENPSGNEDTDKALLRENERSISELGQIHNHRISAKSRASLNLN